MRHQPVEPMRGRSEVLRVVVPRRWEVMQWDREGRRQKGGGSPPFRCRCPMLAADVDVHGHWDHRSLPFLGRRVRVGW